MKNTNMSLLVGRRAELLAELFLDDLKPSFLGRPTHDIGFDFLIGFTNQRGGVNTFGVEVKGTEQFNSLSFPLDRKAYQRLANSNPPAFLLLVDVKQNRFFCGWPQSDNGRVHAGSERIKVPLTEMNERTKTALRQKLSDENPISKIA
jgi:hypothetical protein